MPRHPHRRPTTRTRTLLVRALLTGHAIAIRGDAVTTQDLVTRVRWADTPAAVALLRREGLDARAAGAEVLVTWPAP